MVAALPSSAAAQSGSLSLPVVVIDTPGEIVNEPKVTGTVSVIDRQFREQYRGPIGIERHGFSSLENDPKLSYDLETREPSGEARNVSLLELPKDDDWILVAGYRDGSLLRNLLAYSTSRWLGRYAPRTRLVEVVKNRRYDGVYLLAEELKLHKRRVAVDSRGGYLLQMVSSPRVRRKAFFTTRVSHQQVLYEDPKLKGASSRRTAGIREYVDRFERRLYGRRFRDPRRGYSRSLDVGAAVDFLLLNELFRNGDTFRHSTYMYKGAGRKLVLGPLWDFDHALGNDSTPKFNRLSGWQYNRAAPWAGRLYADPAFRRRMVRRWRTLRRRGLLAHLISTIDSGAGELAEAQERNFRRWLVFGTGETRVPDPRTGAPPANHAQAIDYLKWWISGRTRWIDANIARLRP